jgi:hypothetical protein
MDEVKDAILVTPGSKAGDRFGRSTKLVRTPLSRLGRAVTPELIKDGLIDDIVSSDEVADCGIDQFPGVD